MYRLVCLFIILCFRKIQQHLRLVVDENPCLLDIPASLLGSVGELCIVVLLDRFLLRVQADGILLIVREGTRGDLLILEGVELDLVLRFQILDLLLILGSDRLDLRIS